jgi:single-stranded-DNA-specific exonuclease
VRGPAGSRLHDALSLAQGALVRFGGHQQAAGLEVLEQRLGELRARFVDAVRNQAPAPPVDASAELLLLEPGDAPLAVLNDLDRLEPCGFGNPRPKLRAVGEVREAREVKNGHLKLRIDLGRHGLACFAVGHGAVAADLRGKVEVHGDLRHNTYPGGDPVELFTESISPLASGSAAIATHSPGTERLGADLAGTVYP